MLVLSLTIDKVLAKNDVLLDTDALCNPHCPKRSSSPEKDPLQSGGRHYRPSHFGLHQQSKEKQDPTGHGSSQFSTANLMLFNCS